MLPRLQATLILCALLAGACRTTTTISPPNLASGMMVRAMPREAWQVVEGDRVAGYVVRYESSGANDRAYFSVRNEHQQELGVVDVDGRAWRYRAHQREPDWLGTGTVSCGARGILSCSEKAVLVPVGLLSLVQPIVAVSPR